MSQLSYIQNLNFNNGKQNILLVAIHKQNGEWKRNEMKELRNDVNEKKQKLFICMISFKSSQGSNKKGKKGEEKSI